MKTGARPVLPIAEDRPSTRVTPLTLLPPDEDAADEERARLLRRLARDRLRGLRDDGVTIGYMARVYGVEQRMMEEVLCALGLTAG